MNAPADRWFTSLPTSAGEPTSLADARLLRTATRLRAASTALEGAVVRDTQGLRALVFVHALRAFAWGDKPSSDPEALAVAMEALADVTTPAATLRGLVARLAKLYTLP